MIQMFLAVCKTLSQQHLPSPSRSSLPDLGLGGCGCAAFGSAAAPTAGLALALASVDAVLDAVDWDDGGPWYNRMQKCTTPCQHHQVLHIRCLHVQQSKQQRTIQGSINFQAANHPSTSANQNVTIKILRKNPKEWKTCFPYKLKHRNWVENWLIMNETFEVNCNGTHAQCGQISAAVKWSKLQPSECWIRHKSQCIPPVTQYLMEIRPKACNKRGRANSSAWNL